MPAIKFGNSHPHCLQMQAGRQVGKRTGRREGRQGRPRQAAMRQPAPPTEARSVMALSRHAQQLLLELSLVMRVHLQLPVYCILSNRPQQLSHMSFGQRLMQQVWKPAPCCCPSMMPLDLAAVRQRRIAPRRQAARQVHNLFMPGRRQLRRCVSAASAMRAGANDGHVWRHVLLHLQRDATRSSCMPLQGETRNFSCTHRVCCSMGTTAACRRHLSTAQAWGSETARTQRTNPPAAGSRGLGPCRPRRRPA